MELYQLRGFATVAELGHLTRAAERLHISQPALSAQVRSLEDELGLVLFDRSPAGMQLTAAGRRLLPEIEKVLAAAQALRDQARAIRGDVDGTVIVGTVSDPGTLRLAPFLAAAMERYPGLHIQVPHEVSGVAFERVRDRALDASFYYGDLTHPSVASLRLRELGYRVVVPAAWGERLAKADWNAIAAEPWIMTPAVSTHRQLATSMFRRHGVEPANHVEADNETVIASLVISGLGLALMREEQAIERVAAGEVAIWRDVRLVTPLTFIYLNERRDDPIIRALIDVVEDVWELQPAATVTASSSVRARA